MKKTTAILTGFFLLTLIAACSTSPGDSDKPFHPQVFGTWKTVSKTKALWNGLDHPPAVAAMALTATADSSTADTLQTPDTTYYYQSGDIRMWAEEYNGDRYSNAFNLVVMDKTKNNVWVDSTNFAHPFASNLTDAFKVVGWTGTRAWNDSLKFIMQIKFNCGSTKQNNSHLIIGFESPIDTIGYYNLSTNGLYSTAQYLSCH
jgi:hypothetical protein